MSTFTRLAKHLSAKLAAIISFIFLLFSTSAFAQVYSEFTTGVIAEYSGPNANQNDYAVLFQDADKPISKVIVSQSCDYWGCGTSSMQGNDTVVDVEIFFQDGSPSVTVPGSFNWVLNKSGGGIYYFGIVFDPANQPNDGLFQVDPSALKTYILPIPNLEATLVNAVPSDSTDGSANFGSNEISDIVDALTLYFSSEITLQKTASPYNDVDNSGDVSAGDTIDYSFTITNAGSTELTNITVSDALAGVVLSGGPIATLASGASDSSTFSAVYTITTSDISNGSVTNTATVSAISPYSETITATDTAVSQFPLTSPPPPVLASPEVALVKEATLVDTDGNGGPSVGDIINYSFTVYNIGQGSFSVETIVDPLITVTGGLTNIAEGANDSSTYSGTYSLTADDILTGYVENTASVVAFVDMDGNNQYDSGEPSATDTSGTAQGNDDPTVTPLNISPSIALVKTATFVDTDNSGGASAGDTITYSFAVSNTGNVPLTVTDIADAKITVSGGPVTLQPGDVDDTTFSGSYTITLADIIEGEVENTATVNAFVDADEDGIQDAGEADVQDTSGTDATNDDPTVTPLTAEPSIALVKTATFVDTDNSGGASAGDTITYAFAVSNTGNVPLTVTDIADAKITVSGGPVTLQPGDVDDTTFSGSYTITLADIVAGEVENTATVNAFVDADEDGVQDAGEADVQDTSGTDATNDDPTVTPLTAIVDIALVKSADYQDITGNGSSSDDIITYSFEVTNMGNVELTDVIVTDDDVSWADRNTEIGRITSLLPGQSQSFSKDYQITNDDINAGSIVNQALASATAPGGLSDPSDLSGPSVDSNEVIETLLGSIAGQSVNKNGSIAAGVTAILYKKVNGTLIEVARTVTDAQGAYSFNELEQAEYCVEFIKEGSYVYGQGEDVQDTNGASKEVVTRKNIVDSIVLATGSMTAEEVDAILIDPSGVVYDSRTFVALAGAEVYLERVTGAGTEIVPSAQINGGDNPVITGADGVYSFFFSDPAPTGTYTLRIVKAGYETVDGSTSTYSTLIPASTSANGVSGLTFVTDGQVAVETGPGVIEITAAAVQPATIDQAQYFGAFDMTFADWTDENALSKGIIHNHVPMDMTAPIMGMKVTKTADISGLSSVAAIGETITYTITAENTGNDSYANVAFDDPLTDDVDEVLVTGDASLDPGEIWTWTTEYTLTAADIAAGKVENTATVTGTTPIGDVEAYDSSEAGNMTKGAGNGSPTVVTLATLLEQIEDDLKIVLADDLAMTMRQHSGVMKGYASGALARLKSSPSERSCATAVNAAINGRNIEFDTASDVILAKNGPVLDDIAKAAMTCTNEVLTIGGHTDDRASEAYNQDLSERRAKSVRVALAQRGVPVEILKAKGFGELRPIATNATEDGRQANRRVEFTSQKSGTDVDPCKSVTQASRTASMSATDSNVSGNGSFNRETTNCEERSWAVTDGSGNYLKTDEGMKQWMFDLSHRRERMIGEDAVRGWFVGAYGTNNQVTGLATGDITGYGLSGGIYGANRIEKSIFLDYYVGVAAGQHTFDLDFQRATVINAIGDYKYLAYFAGIALSGEKELDTLTLAPRAGVDLAYTNGADINVTAQDAFRSDVGDMRLDAMSGGRVFAELGIEHTLTSDAISETTISFTPKAFCDRPIGKSDMVCGYGARVDVSQNHDASDNATKFFLNYEASEGSEAAAFGMSVEKRILNDMGLLSSKLSASDKANPVLNLLMDLKF